ncbi:peptidase inhibitor family I36 protein [Streptomyces sp. NPDC058045]|uniref:peptidase inhibitor family I36 protein n=1 Tax=Streptomyces sp. NPDC058045 TaxID=3346311 RepID=UPI0036E6218C
MPKFRIALAAAGTAALLGGLSAPAASAAPTASAAPAASVAAPATSARYTCSAGYFCIYSGWNGGGSRCQWKSAKVSDTAANCSFIRRGYKVKSVWNGTGKRKQFYTSTNYHHRIGSTRAGSGGNLQGNYQIRSFKPQ